MKDFYEKLHATAENAGLKILSDEHCCKLLAWLYAFGGGDESVVFNYKLNVDIKTAQKRLNIEGGETPNAELLPILQGYLREVNPFFTEPQKPVTQPEWVKEICKYYGLSVR